MGEIGLGYDVDSDMIVLVARENATSDVMDMETGESVQDSAEEFHDGRVVRFWCTRDQIRTMCRWGMEIVSRGRKTCPQCGEPMDPAGHFCPKKNGHKK